MIFTAPPHSGARAYDTYMLYNRAYHAVEQPGARRLRRPGDRDPRLPDRHVGRADVPERLGRSAAMNDQESQHASVDITARPVAAASRAARWLLVLRGVAGASRQPATGADAATATSGIVCTTGAGGARTRSST